MNDKLAIGVILSLWLGIGVLIANTVTMSNMTYRQDRQDMVIDLHERTLKDFAGALIEHRAKTRERLERVVTF